MSRIRTLHASDTVGLMAPASPPADPDALARGANRLTESGFRLADPRPAFSPVGYLSAPDAARAEQVNGLLRRPETPLVFAVRGGYGCLRLLDIIDYQAARDTPTLLVGYSDVTALQLALLARADLPSVSGAMAAVEWAQGTGPWTRPLLDVLAGGVLSELTLPGARPLTCLKAGKAEGRLVGGNLSVFCRLIGTPFMPDLVGALLFFEDVGEPPYRIDGMLAQLRLSGILGQAAGLVFGDFSHADQSRPTLKLTEVLETYAPFVDGPVAAGLPYGHFADKVPVPIGVRGRLEAGDGTARVAMLEPVTHRV